MLGKYTTSHMRSPWRLLLGVLCISLIVLGGTLSVTHTHAREDVSHADCGLCVAAHMAVDVAAVPAELFVFHVFTEVEAPRPVTRLPFVPEFALFSRPPPASAHLS
jgi:hypothetical protein